MRWNNGHVNKIHILNVIYNITKNKNFYLPTIKYHDISI